MRIIHGIRESKLAPEDRLRAWTVCGLDGSRRRGSTDPYVTAGNRRFAAVDVSLDRGKVDCENCLRGMR